MANLVQKLMQTYSKSNPDYEQRLDYELESFI